MKKLLAVVMVLFMASIPLRNITITIASNQTVYEALHLFSYSASLAIILPTTLLLYIRYRDRLWAKDLTLSIVMVGIIITLLKLLISSPRPTEDYLNIWIINHIDQYGYPSGHTAAATIYAYYIHKANPKHNTKHFTTLWAITIGLSRIFTGAHYIGDVIAGYATGLTTILITKLYHQHRHANP